jgi:hypothetical protein
MGYTVKFYKATADYSSNNYASVAATSLSGLADYTASGDIQCRLVNINYSTEIDHTVFLGGEKSSVNQYRRKYELTFLTGGFRDATFDINDIESLILDYFTSEYLWVSFEAFGTASGRAKTYHTTAHVLPIVVDEYSLTHDEKNASVSLTVTLSHRWRNK